ncbi:restriction endonuclease subunit S [Comamonas aquatica]|uniref:restriction endonuclease subunit S n=2 Tax=Comamonas aquatica TaxID=225991 RepID=UPI003209572B
MSSEWKTLPLEDCLEALIDYRGKTPEKTSFGIPLITAKIIKLGRIETPTEFIAKENYDSWMRRGIPQAGDVVLTVEAPLGEVAQLGPEKIALAQRVVTLRGKKGLLDSTYLLYLLQSEEIQEKLKARATGTTVLGIKQSELRKVELNIPPIDFQKQAAALLKVIDDRITLLRASNTTLEAIAQTLFKSWFVDFDPVHAKQQGRAPEGMDAQTAALFPDSFEESELRMVPKGWSYSTVGQSFILTMGQSPPGDTYNENGEGLPFYQGRTDFGFRFPSQRIFCSAPTRFAEKGDTLVSVRAPVGDVNMALERCCIGRGVASVRHPMGYSGFAFYAMRSLDKRFKTFDSEGTVFGSISKKDFQNLPVIEVSEGLLRVYDSITSSLDTQIVNNELIVRSLTALRDTLLPRLISGQLRLPEAQALVEESVDA